MKLLLLILSFFSSFFCFGQNEDCISKQPGKIPKRVNFIAKVDIRQATKDGIYLNGYVVNLGYEEARALDGKSVRVKGRVTIVKGIKRGPGGEVNQGRECDTMHIKTPRISIVT